MNPEKFEGIAFTSNKQKAQAAQLHAELKYLKQLDQLQIHLDSSSSLVYFTGFIGEDKELYIPLGTDETITMSQVALVQEELLQKHNVKRLTMAFMEGDSTTVYFSFTPGFLPPNEVMTRRDLVDQEHQPALDDIDEFEGEI